MAKARDLPGNELVSTEPHFTICLQRRNQNMVRPADMTLNIKNQQTPFAGLPSQEKQFFYHEFLFRPVQAGVRNPHVIPTLLSTAWYKQTGVVMHFYLHGRHDFTPSACALPHPWGSSQPGVKWLFVAPLAINWEQGAVLKVDSFLVCIEKNIFPIK